MKGGLGGYGCDGGMQSRRAGRRLGAPPGPVRLHGVARRWSKEQGRVHPTPCPSFLGKGQSLC
jgi:hypothetical protein